MKKIILSVLSVVLMGSTAALAQDAQIGGFKGASADVVTSVSEIKNLPDDKRVVLQGNIERQIRGDKYEFKDATGSIVVEIDDDEWRGVVVEPANTVKIVGEVDKSFFEPTTIDVDSIQLVP